MFVPLPVSNHRQTYKGQSWIPPPDSDDSAAGKANDPSEKQEKLW